MIVDARGLSVQAGRRYLLKAIDWQVEEGEHWLIFGMNGSGKTTLLSVLAGFKPPSAGSLRVLGQSYARETLFSLRRRVGFVSSSFFDHIYRNESALEIVLSGYFGTFGLGYGLKEVQVRRAKAFLGALGLGDQMRRPFVTLSKGERQNVLIARALAPGPELLLLDEPCSGLDLCAQAQFAETLEQLARAGAATMLYVTHHPEEIPPFAKKTLLLRHGQVFAQGETEAMLSAERLSKLLQQSVTVQRTDGTVHIQFDKEG